jgi:hypothetical protein
MKSFNKFIKTFEFYINLEINFSFFQVIKYLNFINLQYSNINNNKYIENVPIFSYYIITLILLYNYENFGIWCINNNGFKQFIVFKKTINNQIKFYEFIKKEYNTIKFLNIIERFNTFFININNIKYLNNNFKKYLINNLRMSIIEI